MVPRRYRLTIAILIPLAWNLLASAPTYAARLEAGLQHNRIYLGTQTLLVVEVADARNADWPTVRPVPGLEIERYGRPSVMRDLFSRRTTYRYKFIVTPARAGTFEIPGVSLATGGVVLRDGPFTLQVKEAPLRFRAAEIDPTQILVGQTATLNVVYQGVRPDVDPVVPEVDGLDIRPIRLGRVDLTEREGLPITIHSFEVKANRLGRFRIAGITFDDVPADPVTLTVSEFVVVGAEIAESSLVVGSRTTAHVLIRGLPESTQLTLEAPDGVRIAPARQKYRSRAAGSLFSFDVTATEPGNFTIDTVKLPDGRKAELDEPLTLAVRQAGAGDIFACRGIPSSEETVVGEPFTIDFEVFFRGDFKGAAIDLSQASFANKDYIKVEPVDNVSYSGRQSDPIAIQFGNGNMRALLGSGEYNDQKEQMLRFAMKITPLATGELSLDGLRVILLLQITEERRTATTFFSSSQTKQYARVAEVPPHQVIDPPGITRPPLYNGAVGESFTFTTELDRTSATAMSPLTLTLSITGNSVGPQFAPPPLTQVSELTRDFDVSSTVHGGDVADSTITFTQVVRPRSEAVTELPALPLVYYDYERKEYKTVYSLPIPIEVRPGSLVGAADMEAGADPTGTSKAESVQRQAQSTIVLGANHTTLGKVVVAPLSLSGLVVLLVAGPAGIILVLTGHRVYRRRRPQAITKQQKKDLQRALGELDGTGDFYLRLADILQSYLRLSFDLPPGELSPDTLARAFDNAGLDGPLRDEARDLLEACDAGRFAAGDVSHEEKARLTKRARELFRALDRGGR